MFRAIRNWRFSGKARHWVGLFAFEFVVVVLGVLTAQAVADWSRNRAAMRDMLANKGRADAQIAFLAGTSIAYGRVIPCMEQRMIGVMRDASDARQVDPKILIRPILWSLPYNELTGESLLNIRANLGNDVSDNYERIAGYVVRSNQLVDSLARDWEALSIISSDSGTVGPGDRQEARILASRMRSTLRSLGKMSSNIAFRSRNLGIAPTLEPGQRLPGGCADLWRWNSVLYDPEDVPADRDRPPPNA
jgi:hypothetical protein